MAMFRTFPLNTWREGKKYFTAKKLLDRIRKDRLSDYNWVASASELVKTCNLPYFPAEARAEIEDSILECFANISVPSLYEPSYSEPGDKLAVFTCYQDSQNEELKNRFLSELIRRYIILSYGDGGKELYYFGDKHDEFENSWSKRILSELHNRELNSEEIDYIAWEKSLLSRYEEDYDFADSEGYFESDHEAQREYFKLNRKNRQKSIET